MANKTTQTEASVEDFINTAADTPQRKQDCLNLVNIMKDASGFDAKMWGPAMIGFGSYYYKSDRSKQQGEWFLIGFSPRKAAISLYLYGGAPVNEDLLNRLGKFKKDKGCVHIKTLADIDADVLKAIAKETIGLLQAKWGTPSPQ